MRRVLVVMIAAAACGHGGAAPVAPGTGAAVSDAGPPDSRAEPDHIAVVDGGAAVAVDPPDAAPVAHPPPKGPPKVAQINASGELIDIDKSLVADHVTIVDFWATWCGGCKIIEAKFMEKIVAEAHVVVRKVDVGDGDTPVAKHYNVHGLPQVWIYDAKKRLRYVLVANDALKTGDIALELAKDIGSGN